MAAEGIKSALKNGTVLPSTRTYLGLCSSSEIQQENTSGKELARHLNEVRGLKTVFVHNSMSFTSLLFSIAPEITFSMDESTIGFEGNITFYSRVYCEI